MAIRILPELDEDLLLNLFHKAAKVQWTSRDLDWSVDLRLSDRGCLALARLLTPVYLGEQTAMLGASSVLPQMARAGETTAQLYLASFILDEARHFEALTRLYRRLGYDPVGMREMPQMLRYHHRLRQGDRVDWVWGILISDLFAKHFYQLFAAAQPEALFGRMSARILQDESRHQAFADHYLRRALPALPSPRRQALIEMRDDLIRLMETMYDQLRADTEALAIDGDAFLHDLVGDIESWSRRIGLIGGPPDGDGGGADGSAVEDRGEAAAPARPERRRSELHAEATPAGGCATCFMALICRSRLVAQATPG